MTLLRGVERLYDRAEAWVVRVVGRQAVISIGIALMIVGSGQVVPPLSDAFYATVAQVLPVFVLVAVVEGRYFAGADDREPFDRFFLKSLLLLPVVAEVAALAAPAVHHDHELLRGVVVVGTGTAILLMWLYATIGAARPAKKGLLAQAESVRQAVEGGDAERERPPNR